MQIQFVLDVKVEKTKVIHTYLEDDCSMPWFVVTYYQSTG